MLDIASGAVVHTVAGVGGDEIWFNPGDEHVYFADSELNRIFVPVSNVGVKVYTDDHDSGEGADN